MDYGQRTTPQPNFDRIARPYRWLEYLTLGRALERCRLHFLPRLADRNSALVLGDGDGRFLAALLAQNSALTADAVDISAAMLGLLRDCCERTAPNAGLRLHTHRNDALGYLAAPSPAIYDFVVTHFFLDCLTQTEVEALAAAVSARLAPGGIWLVSDFRIPPGIMQIPAKMLVRSLYLAFRILTGLRANRLPDHAAALSRAGLCRIAQHCSLFGVLTTELWTLPAA